MSTDDAVTIDKQFIADLCEGLMHILDTLERKMGKPIRTATMRKVFKDLRRSNPELINEALKRYQ